MALLTTEFVLVVVDQVFLGGELTMPLNGGESKVAEFSCALVGFIKSLGHRASAWTGLIFIFRRLGKCIRSHPGWYFAWLL